MRRLLALLIAVLIYTMNGKLFVAALGALILADMIKTVRKQTRR